MVVMAAVVLMLRDAIACSRRRRVLNHSASELLHQYYHTYPLTQEGNSTAESLPSCKVQEVCLLGQSQGRTVCALQSHHAINAVTWLFDTVHVLVHTLTA